MSFDLSQGLFSSAGVDAGTKLLLKVFSRLLDECAAEGKPLPRRILDAGCGAGIIGICAAAAVAPSGGAQIRCQDRDELARLFTLHNAAKNGIPPGMISAHAEPLLAGPRGAQWDLILTNIPAKAGTPVLEDFIRRSAALLGPGGKAVLVAVQPLAGFFRAQIAAGAKLEREESGPGHTVFLYGALYGAEASCGAEAPCGAGRRGSGFFDRYPFYARASAICPIEGMPIQLETIHGASGFDQPGGAAIAAAKLFRSIAASAQGEARILIHEPGQGFFPCWLVQFLQGAGKPPQPPLALSGRNILALEASRRNLNLRQAPAFIAPAADLQLGRDAVLQAAGGRPFSCIFAFPELLPQGPLPKGSDQLAALWESIPALLCGGGIFLAAFSSSDAERFDRKKPAGFARLGSVKRSGFRALAYKMS